MHPFVVLSVQRSGSTMLIHRLDSHPQVTAAGEVFKKKNSSKILRPEYSFHLGKKLKSWKFKLFRKQILSKHLALFLKADSGQCKGFKLMASQIDLLPDLVPMLRSKGFKFIFLFRERKVDQVLSLQVARQSSRWTKKQGEVAPMVLSLGELQKDLSYCLRSDERLKQHIQAGDLVMCYEELIEQIEDKSREILQFLEVDETIALKTSMKKSSRRSYRDRLQNYEEVKAFFADKGMGSFPE